MKRLILVCVIALASVWSISSMAESVGIVDMDQILQSAPQVKNIEKDLQKQFTARKAQLDKVGQSLQKNIADYQKNKAVMDAKKLTTLEGKINEERQTFQQDSIKFQTDFAKARKAQTDQFIQKIKQVVGTIAQQKKLDLVLPKGVLLYTKGGTDITPQVLAKLKG